MRLGLALLLSIGCTASFDRSLIPGREGDYIGFGAAANPGTTRCDVTNTDDSGPGSLRSCLVPGSDVYFDVGGNISLASPLEVPTGTRIRGDTAPEPVVLLLSGFSAISVSSAQDIVIQNLRVQGTFTSGLVDISSASRVVVDRMVIGGGDVGVTVAQSTDITISSVLFSDLDDVGVKVQGGSNRRITLARNVVHVSDDVIRVQGFATDVQLVNNVANGWAWLDGSAGAIALRSNGQGTPTRVDVVGNVIVQGSGNESETRSFVLDGVDESDVHTRGNRFEGMAALDGEHGEPFTEIDFEVSLERIFTLAGPADRTSAEADAIESVRDAL